MKVIIISKTNSERRLPARSTSFRERMVKNLMFLKAQITAKVRNKQESVFQSKYSRYALSGGTKKHETTAASAAMQKTTFFFKNLMSFLDFFKLSPIIPKFATR